MVYNVYGQHLTPHLIVSDVPDLDATRDGKTNTKWQSESQVAFTLISLNGNTLPNSSTEFIVATILHEAGHSLVNYYHPEDNIDGENQLAIDYQNQISIELKKMFPTLTNAQATALAWGGLENTPLYKQQIGVNQANYTAINKAFRNGTSGSKPCSAMPVE